MSLDDKKNYLLETKNQIKAAIQQKGVVVQDTDTFRSYANKISEIQSGGSNEDDFWNLRTLNGHNGTGLFYYYKTNTAQENAKVENYIKNIDTSQMTTFERMFEQSNIENIDFSNKDTSKCTSLFYFTNNNKALKVVDFTNCDFSNVTNISAMFINCIELIEVKGILNFTKVNSTTQTFGTAYSPLNKLQKIYIANLKTQIDLRYTLNIIKECLIFLINNLQNVITTRYLMLGDNSAKLTAEEIAVATNKGWTIS